MQLIENAIAKYLLNTSNDQTATLNQKSTLGALTKKTNFVIMLFWNLRCCSMFIDSFFFFYLFIFGRLEKIKYSLH